MSERSDALLERLRTFGRTLPGAHGKSPWPGHDDLAVNDKTFAYLSMAGEPFKVSFKLPYTGDAVLELPYATPASYGLGKSGWVTLSPSDEQSPGLEQFQEWMEESYRAQAPKKLVKELDAREDRRR